MTNTFKYKSKLKPILKEFERDQNRQANKAARVLKKAIRNEITSKGLVDDGELLKSVASTTKKGVSIVGVGFPGIILEKGTVERVGSDGHSSGKITPTPFFLPAFKKAQAQLISILSEEW